jgi:hypothetical protein
MLRIKGILSIQGRSRPLVVHAVQHVQHPPVELAAWPSDDRRSKVVFITRDIPRDSVEESLGAFINVWAERGTIPSDAGDGARERCMMGSAVSALEIV